jgi:hypothetical protein
MPSQALGLRAAKRAATATLATAVTNFVPVARDINRLLSAAGTLELSYREFTVPPAPRPGKNARLALLALVSFERESGRTTIARGLISAFARRGLRAVRAHAPPPEFPSRCDLLVVDEPGAPSAQLLAEADAILVVVRPALETVRAAEARLGQLRSYRRGAPRYLASRVDARTDVPALVAMRALLGPRLLATTIHEDPFLDDRGSQVQADFLSLARELRRRRR